MTETFTVTATQGRQQFFDLLNRAQYAGQTTQILKNGKPIAQIVPIETKAVDIEKIKKAAARLRKTLTEKDYQQIEAAHHSLDTSRFPDWYK